jgi:hypothetical protein
MESDTASQETIRRLETELGAYRRAYADLDGERRRAERLKLETDKQKEDLANQLKVTIISNFLSSHLMIAVPRAIESLHFWTAMAPSLILSLFLRASLVVTLPHRGFRTPLPITLRRRLGQIIINFGFISS